MDRRVVYAALIVIVLIGALVAGLALREGERVAAPSPIPSASPSATTGGTATAAAATAAGSPSPAQSVLDDRFGFVVGNQGGSVRSETSSSVISSFTAQGRSFTMLSRVVSPDGRFVAYWARVNDGPVLHVRSVLGGEPRVMLTGRPEMSGNAFTWSSDSTGLVVALDNNCFGVCGATGGNLVAELWTVEIAGAAAEKIATGSIWLPVAWDRAAKLVAAGVTGEGGYLSGYDVIDLNLQPHPVRSTPFRPTVFGRLKASGDARYVLLSVGNQGSPSSLAWWPIAQPEKRASVQYDGLSAEWRPGTSEIWWMDGREPAGCVGEICAGTQLTSFNVATGARTVVLRGRFGSLLEAFRVDGSAAIISAHSTARTELTLIEIATGRMSDVSIGGFLLAPARLR